MQSDFNPIRLKKANAKLGKLLIETNVPIQQNDEHEEIVHLSSWKKFLRLFKANTFVLPEDPNKNKHNFF